MADELPPMPEEDTAPPLDPFEAELVAYLDGELEPAAARRIEARLASDPQARAKAAELKKTFDLLDYLPKPEPSPAFATRTLDRLPALQSGQVPVPAAPATELPASPSLSVPVALATSAVPLAVPAPLPPRPAWVWAFGLLVAVAAFAAVGYVASAALRPLLFPEARRESSPEEPPPPTRILENLPLYAAADDLEFVRELDSPELFGADPSVSFDSALKPGALPQDRLSDPEYQTLLAAFKAMPAARQTAIRELDRSLFALEQRSRDRLFRVLEAYTVWLDRLPPAERKTILEAPSREDRVAVVREVRERQWADALPDTQKKFLAGLAEEQRRERIKQWRYDEAARRDDWGVAANRAPWPFENEADRRVVLAFMQSTFRTDDPKRCRFTSTELERYNAALTAATDKGGWTWYAFGREVYALSKRYEKELLPEPARGEPVTSYAQLGDARKFFEKEKSPAHQRTVNTVGKWPDFALAVHNVANNLKGDKIVLPQLGPARADEFKEPLRRFIEKELPAKLKGGEKLALRDLEGKWPEYPREIQRLAQQHDLSAPGMMLPFSPLRWELTYGIRARP